MKTKLPVLSESYKLFYLQTYHCLYILQDLLDDDNHRSHRSLNRRSPSDRDERKKVVVWKSNESRNLEGNYFNLRFEIK